MDIENPFHPLNPLNPFGPIGIYDGLGAMQGSLGREHFWAVFAVALVVGLVCAAIVRAKW